MGMGGGGGQFGGVMRSMRRDDSVTQQQVTKGTAGGCSRFARPYRTILVWFLVLIIVDAVIGAANPLIYRAIIDNGIRKHRHEPDRRARPASSPAWPCSTPGCTIGNRWVSARIGEGLIFDMRAQVFAHIQKMPIAFFTRTQTGALVAG